MATLTRPAHPLPNAPTEGRKAVRDSLAVAIGGQLDRALGTITSLVMRWWIDPDQLGVYTGLRLYLDNTNRSSLGVGLGAVQEIPILRAAGREAEAQRIANIAYTTNTLTCLIYAAMLVAWAWFRLPVHQADPLAAEWTWGLVSIAGLALIKRYESFLVAILRAHGAFVLTAELDVVESLISAITVAIGVGCAGFWGLLGSVGVLLLSKIAYAHARYPIRFAWAWDLPEAWRLLRIGVPILVNTAVFGAILSLDRMLILWRIPDGDRAAGLYTIALLGTNWSLDLAGRLVLVAYNRFQTTLGRTSDPAAVALQAMRACEAQTPVLLAGSAVAFVVGPTFLGTLVPRYVDGLPALRPLLPGMILLGLAWPARQFLITIGRPYRLCLAAMPGLVLTFLAGLIGADRAGIVGVAWGMSLGYAGVFLGTSVAAFPALVGATAWTRHLGRLALIALGYTAATLATAYVPLPFAHPWIEIGARAGLLALWLLPALGWWGRCHNYGGLLANRPRLHAAIPAPFRPTFHPPSLGGP